MYPVTARGTSVSGLNRIHCEVCGRIVDCTVVDLRVYRAIGAPHCCGKAMELPPGRQYEHRYRARRFCRRDVQVDIRRSPAVTEPNLGKKVTDVSSHGIGARITAEVLIGEELQVILWRFPGLPIATIA